MRSGSSCHQRYYCPGSIKEEMMKHRISVWTLLSFVLAAIFTLLTSPASAKDTSINQGTANLPGIVTISCDSSTICIGKADYTITYMLSTDGGKKSMKKSGRWACQETVTISNLPVNTKAKIKVDWKTSKFPNRSKTKKMMISPDNRNNKIVISM